jgi:hypothetical protein
MKNISFKRKESLIRGLEQKKEVRNKGPRNWDRIVYLLILALFSFFLISYLINKFLYVEADGQVLFDKVDIRNTDDCRIIDLYVGLGEQVNIGDSLFSFLPDQPPGGFNEFGTYEFAMGQRKNADVSWAEKEIFKKQEDIKLNNYVIGEKTKMLNILNSEMERIRNEVSLDVLPRTALDNHMAKMNQLKYDIEALKGENRLIYASFSQLKGMIRKLGTTGEIDADGNTLGGGNATNPNKIFYSPLKGTITQILKNNFEVALKEEVILSIHRPKNIFIKAYFEQSDLEYLSVNDIVNIEFPDGTEGKGIIKRFYFSTYQLPEEFQKKYEPTTRALSADIFPLDSNDLHKWKTFWKLGIVITKFKY